MLLLSSRVKSSAQFMVAVRVASVLSEGIINCVSSKPSFMASSLLLAETCLLDEGTCPLTSVSKSYLYLYLLCTTNERKLVNIFVGDINGELLSFSKAVSDTNFDSGLNIIVRNFNAGH